MSEPRWRRSTTTLWRRTTGSVVLLPDDAEIPFLLSGAAALVWDVLEEPTTVSEATELLARACAADPATVRSDVNAVVAQLDELRAAVTVDPHPC